MSGWSNSQKVIKMTIDQMAAAVTKAIENNQIVKVIGTHYPVTVEIDNEAIYTANNRREVFYSLKHYWVDTSKVIWI